MISIPLANSNLLTFVDDRDSDVLQHQWQLSSKGYAARSIYSPKPATILLSRIILERKLKRALVKGEECDHRDLNKLNNCRRNLRVANHGQNQLNTHKPFGTYTSQYKGVHWVQKMGKWRARIGVHKKHIHVGYYVDEKDAARAYDRAAIKYFGQFARLNNP